MIVPIMLKRLRSREVVPHALIHLFSGESSAVCDAGQAGWGQGEGASRDIFNAYVDAGGNFVDTADLYSAGRSEEMVGTFIRERGLRDQVAVATKSGFATGKGLLAGGNGAKHVHAALDGSLRRLQTDYVDLLWLHVWDGVTPAEELLETMATLVCTGKIRYWGPSNSPAWFVAKLATLAAVRGMPGPIALQYFYSLANRDIEDEHVPLAAEFGLGIQPWSPLAFGLLAGKYDRATEVHLFSDGSLAVSIERAVSKSESVAAAGLSPWQAFRALVSIPGRNSFMTQRFLPLLPFVTSACLAAAISAASAQAPPPPWQGVYEGLIGKAPVVVALSPLSARYFYMGRSNDLGLIIPEDGNLSSLQETLAPDIRANDVTDNSKLLSGTWSLAFAHGKLTGTWKDAQGQHASAIALTRVSTADEGSDSAVTTLDRPGDYDSRWLRGAPALVAQGAPTTIGPLSLQMMRDPAFGGAVPRLTRAPANVGIGAVNAGLERLQRYLRLQDRGCFQGQRTMRASNAEAPIADIDKPEDNDESFATLEASYATDRLLVLEEYHMSFCGGAHPSLNATAYTFDLRTGALLTGGSNQDDELDGLGPAGLGRALDLAKPAQRAKFDELWRAAMRKQIAAVAGSKDDDGCGKEMEGLLAEPKVWINAYPATDGLTVRLSGFPEAMRICEVDPPLNPVILPYASLKPFLKPGQRLLPTQ